MVVSSAPRLHLTTCMWIHACVFILCLMCVQAHPGICLCACALKCVGWCVRITWRLVRESLLPAPQEVAKQWGWKEAIHAGRKGWKCMVQGKKRKESGAEAEYHRPGVRCCQDNSQQQYLLRRTKQNYLREQKSANTCLGGGSWGTEWEKGWRREGGWSEAWCSALRRWQV